jgi:hypothetical protein
MTSQRLATLLTVAALFCGCTESTSSEPITPAPIIPAPIIPAPAATTATVADPVGDTFGTAVVRWDMTALTITRDTAGITVKLDFANDVISPTSGDTTAMIGFVDFDVDQNPATGVTATVDEYRPGSGSSGMGSDYQLVLLGYAADSSVAVNDSKGVPTGRVKPVFSGRGVTIRIPKAMLGNDDGLLNAAAIVGSGSRPSDIIPENGHLTLGATQSSGVRRPAVATLRAASSGARTTSR